MRDSRKHIEYIESRLNEIKSKNYNITNLGKVVVEENFDLARYDDLSSSDSHSIIPAYPKEDSYILMASDFKIADMEDYERGYLLVPQKINRAYAKKLFTNLIDAEDKIYELFKVLFYEHYGTELDRAIFDYEYNIYAFYDYKKHKPHIHNEISNREELEKIFTDLEDILSNDKYSEIH